MSPVTASFVVVVVSSVVGLSGGKEAPCVSKSSCGECLRTSPQCSWCPDDVRERLRLTPYFPLSVGVCLGMEAQCDSRQSCGECLEIDEQCSWCSDDVRASSFIASVEEFRLRGVLGFAVKSLAVVGNGVPGLLAPLRHVRATPRTQMLPEQHRHVERRGENRQWLDQATESTSLEGRRHPPTRYDSGNLLMGNLLLPGNPYLHAFDRCDLAGEEQSVKLTYTVSQNYPLDLYYLMDLTNTMKPHLDTLKKIGDELAKTLTNLTRNYQIGFGSFVDKPVWPFAGLREDFIQNPCPDCISLYSFRHHLNFTYNMAHFVGNVSQAKLSGSLDAAEGGLDALYQAAVCERRLGWRNQSRRVILYTTDSKTMPHVAGDGKLGGVTQRVNETCRLGPSGYYEDALEFDYPSIEELDRALTEAGVAVVFAVTREAQNIYGPLGKTLNALNEVTVLDHPDDIIHVIRNAYKNLTSVVKFVDNATQTLDLRYWSSCLERGGEPKETRECPGLSLGDSVNFVLNISFRTCPPKEERIAWIKVNPLGLREKTLIRVKMLCECECERGSESAPSSKRCKNHGKLVCGACECDEGRYGRNCDCSVGGEGVDPENWKEKCRPFNASEEDPMCSGRGSCDCDRCVCDQPGDGSGQVFGPFCECDTRLCPRSPDGKSCGGPTRGVCNCTTCACYDGHSGDDCCEREEDCIPPGGSSLGACSGHGQCVCSVCECHDTPLGRYHGKYCEVCPTCRQQCGRYRDCVECRVFQSGPMGSDCHANCSMPIIEIDRMFQEDDLQGERDRCGFMDETGCRYEFIYYFDSNQQVMIEASTVRRGFRPGHLLPPKEERVTWIAVSSLGLREKTFIRVETICECQKGICVCTIGSDTFQFDLRFLVSSPRKKNTCPDAEPGHSADGKNRSATDDGASVVPSRHPNGEEQSVKPTYTMGKNHPRDLYYLMDLTNTMKPHLDTLKKIDAIRCFLVITRDELAKTLTNLSLNYRIEFGSFVDKPVWPFAGLREDFIQNPCRDCVPLYGFRHHLNFTYNIPAEKKPRYKFMRSDETS
ncbi:unnamed protein product [Darwinula stevensoni]|uniref:Integrin beta n=1 Tax=Darwinula stevensoni TaxID=69355 RepID=A0A7R9A0H6_9CRUS|nr:unnamed protein product [Darwinula stevensoni]CAG0885589.1 unnamed protein product [Darwinula stevensoni]